ncbi:MAG: DUF5060 domain-containing protein [Phycisphaerales bacterium]|nr:DUF5060 domain-containing protein [Phycisphaerales bacterium]
MHKSIIIYLFALEFYIPGAIAQYTCQQWQFMEIRFTLKSNIDSPLDKAFGAILRSSSGRTMDVPGYYTGENTFVLRFCLPEPGVWTLSTLSNIPELSGKEASIDVALNPDRNVRGPVQISRQIPTRFEYTDGSPYFFLAFECDWLFALDAQNKADIPRTREMVSHIKTMVLTRLL